MNRHWSPSSTYTSPLVSNPPPFDIVGISGNPVPHTLTFSRPVSGLVFAIVSMGQGGIGTQYMFDQPFQIIQNGPGEFGNGPFVNLGSNAFGGQTLQGNEAHGLIYFPGTFQSLTWGRRESGVLERVHRGRGSCPGCGRPPRGVAADGGAPAALDHSAGVLGVKSTESRHSVFQTGYSTAYRNPTKSRASQFFVASRCW